MAYIIEARVGSASRILHYPFGYWVRFVFDWWCLRAQSCLFVRYALRQLKGQIIPYASRLQKHAYVHLAAPCVIRIAGGATVNLSPVLIPVRLQLLLCFHFFFVFNVNLSPVLIPVHSMCNLYCTSTSYSCSTWIYPSPLAHVQPVFYLPPLARVQPEFNFKFACST
jgi:hypothetical protein